MLFNYDWWHGQARQTQIDRAKLRCLRNRYEAAADLNVPADSDEGRYLAELEVHTIVYLRDGFSYEIGDLIDTETRSYLMCEVIPIEESWQSGGFVVSVPFEDISRVEIFAIHPAKKPQETPHITGFRLPSDSSGRD